MKKNSQGQDKHLNFIFVGILFLVNKYQYKNNTIMMTRRQSKPFLSDNSDRSIDIATSNSKTDTQTCKNIGDDNVKLQLSQKDSANDQNDKQEKQFEILLKVFDKVPQFTLPPNLAMENVSKKLEQFTTSELLLKEGSNLWANQTQSYQLKQYCRTITSFSEINRSFAILRKKKKDFIAIQEVGRLKLFTANPLALQLLENRRIFFEKFHKKFELDKTNGKLTQLTNEIIFLYHEYARLRRMIVNTKFKDEFKEIKTNPNSKMNLLWMQLRELRKSLRRK